MNQLDLAVHDTTHDFTQGVQELADLMGISYQVLLNKSNPNAESSYYYPHQLSRLQKITGNYAISLALAPKTKDTQINDATVSDAMLAITDAMGRVAYEIGNSGVTTYKQRAECLKRVAVLSSEVDSLSKYLHDCEDLIGVRAV